MFDLKLGNCDKPINKQNIVINDYDDIYHNKRNM